MSILKDLDEFCGIEPWYQGFWRKYGSKINNTLLILNSLAILAAIVYTAAGNPFPEFNQAILLW